jgi:hypothetical protein
MSEVIGLLETLRSRPKVAAGEPEGRGLEAAKAHRRAHRGPGGGGCSEGSVGPVVEWVIGIPVEWVIGIGGLVLGVVGIVVALLIANHHARKASAELREEVDRLHLLMTHLAIYMEEAGLVKVVRLDEKGRLKLWQPVRPAPGEESEEGPPPTVTHQ